FESEEELEKTRKELNKRDEFLESMGLWEVYERFQLKLSDTVELIKESLQTIKETYDRLINKNRQQEILSRRSMSLSERISYSKNRVENQQRTQRPRNRSRDDLSR
uniref:hypothetical protein n=2 Tax=Bacillati TaxID=1783272 RepID=UPI00051C94E1